MVFAADKCGPGAYNLPLYLAFADPMYCAGLMLPPMIKGFRFHVIDMDNTAGDSLLELDAPAKQVLQAIRSTSARLRQLATVLGPVAADAERRAAVRERARGNGQGGRHPEIERAP